MAKNINEKKNIFFFFSGGGGGGGGGGGLEQVIFFKKNPNLKFFFLRIQIENKKHWVLGGAGVSEFYFTMNPNLK